MFRSANIVFFAMGAALMGSFFLLPLFLQNLRGLSAMETGAMITPQAFAVMIFAPISGSLYPKVGPKRLLAFAMVLFTISVTLFAQMDVDTNIFLVEGVFILMGIAMAFTFIPLQACTFATISHEHTGQASSIFNTNRQVSASIGVAILATVLTSRADYHLEQLGDLATAGQAAVEQAMVSAFHDAFYVGAILAAIGILFALIIRDEDAAVSMQNPMEEMAMH
jgi:MFS family permease